MTAGGELSAAASTPLGARVHATPRAQGCSSRQAQTRAMTPGRRAVSAGGPGASRPWPVRRQARPLRSARRCGAWAERLPCAVAPGHPPHGRACAPRPSRPTPGRAVAPAGRGLWVREEWPGGRAGDRAAPRGAPAAGSRRCWGRNAAGSAGARDAAGPLGGATARRRGAVRQRGPAGRGRRRDAAAPRARPLARPPRRGWFGRRASTPSRAGCPGAWGVGEASAARRSVWAVPPGRAGLSRAGPRTPASPSRVHRSTSPDHVQRPATATPRASRDGARPVRKGSGVAVPCGGARIAPAGCRRPTARVRAWRAIPPSACGGGVAPRLRSPPLLARVNPAPADPGGRPRRAPQ